MHKPEQYKNRIELLQGTLDLIILQKLQWGPQHGYGISLAIKASSNDLLIVDTGSLYPALHRLEKSGWIKSEWDVSDNNQRAKYYKLTAAGKKQLVKERSRWTQFVEAMAGIMKSGRLEMAVLEVKRLTKRYRGIAVVDGVNFSVNSGEITGYLGPNGSGKSTTVKMLTGLVEPSDGEILFNGIDVRRDAIGFKRRLGYVPEEAYVYPSLTAMEYLQLMGRLRGLPENVIEDKSENLLKLFDLHLRRHSPLASYSKGMRQRVLISAALLHDPDILIFDEPLSGLDVSSALLFKHLLSELAGRGKTILYISHVLEVVEKVCEKVIIIYKGRIMAEDSVGRLRDLMHLPSLEDIFAQLVQQENMEEVAKGIVETICRS